MDFLQVDSHLYFHYLQSLLLEFVKKEGFAFGAFRPHLELLGHAGHVHAPTVASISHAWDPKLSF